MEFESLKDFADKNKITLKKWEEILNIATDNIIKKDLYNPEYIKENFDDLFDDIGNEAYKVYQYYEQEYGKKVLNTYSSYIINSTHSGNIPELIAESFKPFDKFFLSLSQSRKSRAGKTFEAITKSLFKKLDYIFDEQVIINGKPDFLIPSKKHYIENPMDCIIFTAKRTLRERWRQIVTEGTRGLGFYLGTIDQSISNVTLNEMLKHRIYVVCPQTIKYKYYSKTVNVISFKQFFTDHLDPAMIRWKNNKVI